MHDNSAVEHTLAPLAERAHMSARNMTRLFTKECGLGPTTFLSNPGIDAARRSGKHGSFTARHCYNDAGSMVPMVFDARSKGGCRQSWPTTDVASVRRIRPSARKTSRPRRIRMLAPVLDSAHRNGISRTVTTVGFFQRRISLSARTQPT